MSETREQLDLAAMAADADVERVQYPNGDVFYFKEDVLHRIGEPAVVRPDGSMEWWEHGVFIRALSSRQAMDALRARAENAEARVAELEQRKPSDENDVAVFVGTLRAVACAPSNEPNDEMAEMLRTAADYIEAFHADSEKHRLESESWNLHHGLTHTDLQKAEARVAEQDKAIADFIGWLEQAAAMTQRTIDHCKDEQLWSAVDVYNDQHRALLEIIHTAKAMLTPAPEVKS